MMQRGTPDGAAAVRGSRISGQGVEQVMTVKVKLSHRNARGYYVASVAQFNYTFHETIADYRWAWKNHGNQFSPPPMTFHWTRI